MFVLVKAPAGSLPRAFSDMPLNWTGRASSPESRWLSVVGETSGVRLAISSSSESSESESSPSWKALGDGSNGSIEGRWREPLASSLIEDLFEAFEALSLEPSLFLLISS